MTPRPLGTHTKPSSSLDWCVEPYSSAVTVTHTILQHKSATESDLRRDFESYGTIERVRIVRDKKGRSRGYAFIVYERERDMKGLHGKTSN